MSVKERVMKGSAAIEMAYIMPIILFLFFAVIMLVFYFHDKTVICGAASETAVVAAQSARKKGEEYENMEQFFLERIHGKLILVKEIDVTVTASEQEVEVSVTGEKGILNLCVNQSAWIVKPEEKIRWIN